MAKNLYFTPDEIIFRDENNNIRSSIFCASDNGIIISSSDQTTTTIKGNLAVTDGSITDGTATLASGALSDVTSITATGAIQGGSITDGTAILASGDLSGVTSITATGAIEGGSITDGTAILASGDLSGVTSITATGAIEVGSITDGTATLTSGDLSGMTSITATGAIQGGSITDGTATLSDGTLTGLTSVTSNEATINGDLNISNSGSLTVGSTIISSDGALTGVTDITASGALTGDSITDGTATLSGGELSNCELKFDSTGLTDILKNNDDDALWTIKPENGLLVFRNPTDTSQKMEYRAGDTSNSNQFKIFGTGAKIEVDSGGTLTDGTATLSGGELANSTVILSGSTNYQFVKNENGDKLLDINPSTGAAIFRNPDNTSERLEYRITDQVLRIHATNSSFQAWDKNTNTNYFDSNDISGGSDGRLKHNEREITNALATVNKLKPQTYYMTKNFYEYDKVFASDELPDDAVYRSGYIAQEVQQISELAHAVRGEEFVGSDIGRLSIRYFDVQPFLCKAIQELDVKNKALEATIENQQATIENQQTSIAVSYTHLTLPTKRIV